MTHAIVQEFERYATLTTNAGYWLEISKPQASAAAEAFCAGIRKLMAAKADFFAHFDYGWAAEAENYAHPLEAQLQFGLLLIISEIAPSHPDYEKLGNICIRTLGSRHINTEAVVRGGNKYIVI